MTRNNMQRTGAGRAMCNDSPFFSLPPSIKRKEKELNWTWNRFELYPGTVIFRKPLQVQHSAPGALSKETIFTIVISLSVCRHDVVTVLLIHQRAICLFRRDFAVLKTYIYSIQYEGVLHLILSK